jgi:hypothetical protein
MREIRKSPGSRKPNITRREVVNSHCRCLSCHASFRRTGLAAGEERCQHQDQGQALSAVMIPKLSGRAA